MYHCGTGTWRPLISYGNVFPFIWSAIYLMVLVIIGLQVNFNLLTVCHSDTVQLYI